MDSSARPVLLTTTDGLIENQTSVAFSADGKTFYYCTNAKDIERRHIWAVPVERWHAGADHHRRRRRDVPGSARIRQISGDPERQLEHAAIAGDVEDRDRDRRPAQKIVFPTSRPGFPMDAHVKPEIVITKAADGLEIHNQLFLPKDLKPGERRPAIVFVHGGPVRQMMPAYHYMQFYHWAYGINEWLASQGYIVMSINYRSGVGYGRSFRTAPKTGGDGQQRISGRGRRRQVSADQTRRRSQPDRNLGAVVRRRAHVAGPGAQFRYLQSRRRSGGRASVGQFARS